MPKVDRLPPDRLFARVDAFSCACPSCAEVLIIRYRQGSRGSGAQSRRNAYGPGQLYNPLSSRLTCPQCRRTYAVGLVLYPVAPKRPAGQPEDQKPTARELLAMREQARGWYAEQIHSGEAPVNLHLTAECVCPLRGWKPTCPVHGLDLAAAEAGAVEAPAPKARRCNTCSGRGYLAGVPEAACSVCGGTGREGAKVPPK